MRLIAYLDSIRARDPAPRSRWEVLTYPGVTAIAFHKVAHRLYRARLFLLARIVNHVARALTAIDIHPGATIGHNLFIDHGFVVIGETAEIGHNVTIYQGATLGGTNPMNGIGGKRHPTVGDNVVISLGAAVLGPIMVGNNARIGANAVVTKDVPEGATMIGIPAKPIPVPAEEKQAPFKPYGTPCSEKFDPVTQRYEVLKCELEALRARLDAFEREERARRSGEAA
ncbi:serine O-acetyltransferase EpsC [Sandaracinobacteroides saxicola]|uniref:Serine acetyltransferase n=1 Tax=Sandaracinobacteroides saxicola TaxID=2759707 RepID=A0A7G5ILM3_9SPHN|nr:serine O-acetyltransferase EpsC [Sandaracinobacteroides saxicola]QMW24265.1 serine acetyltransferase [Sandaracinobacteroides saxicola]